MQKEAELQIVEQRPDRVIVRAKHTTREALTRPDLSDRVGELVAKTGFPVTAFDVMSAPYPVDENDEPIFDPTKSSKLRGFVREFVVFTT